MTRSLHRLAALVALELLLSAPLLIADTLAVPETDEARAQLRAILFAPIDKAASAAPQTVRQTEGGTVFFSTEKDSAAVYLIFSRSPGRVSTVASAGTYIIKRSLRDGGFVQIKIFVQDGSGTYLRLLPMDTSRTQMDVYVDDQPFQTEVVLAQGFDQLLTEPFSTIQLMTSDTVDWSLILPAQRTEGDARLQAIVQTLRAKLKSLGDVEDGAMDSTGKYVFIKDSTPQPGKGGFNCSGFAKWVIDGFYRPLTGTLTDIAALKQRDLEARGNDISQDYEESRDPFFGLDWSRNLARVLEAARSGGALPSADFADVRDTGRFVSEKDAGYSLDDLGSILYILARLHPGDFYLGSVNAQSADGAPFRQHHHVVVLFPYMDTTGVYRAVVMERNVETSVASLQRRFPREDIYLVRVSSDGLFEPPTP